MSPTKTIVKLDIVAIVIVDISPTKTIGPEWNWSSVAPNWTLTGETTLQNPTGKTMDSHSCLYGYQRVVAINHKAPRKLDFMTPRLGKSSSAGSLAAVGLGNMMQNCALTFDRHRAHWDHDRSTHGWNPRIMSQGIPKTIHSLWLLAERLKVYV